MPASRELSSDQPRLNQPARADFISSSRVRLILLSLLTIAGAWLRLHNLGAKSLWLDESLTVFLARIPWRQFSETWWHGDATYQTLYYLLMRAWSPGAYSEVWVRLPAAIFGIASIPLMYLVARKLIGNGPALSATALLTFSATHVYYSQEARSYTMTIFLLLLSVTFFQRAVEEGRRSSWFWWVLFSILAVYGHYFASLVLVAQACSLFFYERPAPWRNVIFLGLVIFAAALPGFSYVLRVPPQHLQYSWMPKASPKEIFHLAMFLGGTHLRFLFVLVLWIAGLVAIAESRRERRFADYWPGMLVLLWAVLPVAIMALVSTRHPVFMQRYMIFSLPAVLILAALGQGILKKWHIGVLLVLALCASSVGAIFKDYAAPREDWRGASTLILSSAHPGDAVLFFPDYVQMPFDYYRERYSNPPALQSFSSAASGVNGPGSNLLPLPSSGQRHFSHVWVVLTGQGVQAEDFGEQCLGHHVAGDSAPRRSSSPDAATGAAPPWSRAG